MKERRQGNHDFFFVGEGVGKTRQEKEVGEMLGKSYSYKVFKLEVSQ